MKVAVVFDNRQRPETTGFYCRRALSGFVDTEHLLPNELDAVPAGLFDLFLFVDDGLDYELPDRLRPSAAWAIDTHIDFQRSLSRFGSADYLFAAQRQGAARLSSELGRMVDWLPLACDPTIHRPIRTATFKVDIAFVGHFLTGRRREYIELLQRNYPNSHFTQAIFDEMAEVYSAAHVGFNCNIANDINMRLFEIPAHGIPLLTNEVHDNGLEDLFVAGSELMLYRDEEELLALVEQLLHEPATRKRFAEAGRARVLRDHTYSHRMRQLMKTFEDKQHTQQPSASPVELPTKSASYFEFPRPDVQALVPQSARRILDIGCGGGRLGEALKQNGVEHVTGIEINPEAAAAAGQRLDEVLGVSLHHLDDDHFADTPFDAIVFADVLEHLRNPMAALIKCRKWLSPDGVIIISIPNSRHHSVVSGLLEGNWTYEPAGLLDEDHVRCFTRRELEKLIFRSGFVVDELKFIPGAGYREWKDSDNQSEIQVGGHRLQGLNREEAEEFFTYQYLSRIKVRAPTSFPLTSIIIVTWNQLAYTRECVDSILCRTDEPFELIFVDNGSTDGTPDYLRSVPNARVICNSENLGFAVGVNQGIHVAKGEQVLLLNNDCVVSTGWLDTLSRALQDDPSNGLVGPVSNCVSGPQQIDVSYGDLASMDGFAWDQRTKSELQETDRLVGFCLMLRREVIDKIGLLDEQFEIGCFEDDDLCRRAIEAGYRALIVRNSFVHHYGSATFQGANLDFAKIMGENERRYRKKWGSNPDQKPQKGHVPKEECASPEGYHLHRLPDGQDLLQRNTVRLSLCMIVRDNEETIADCLDSIYPWVDEIIVVDTGSVDRTPQICQSFGARMFTFPWCDDFSAARNVSIEPAKGEWIFWMDSDDVIDQEQGRQLRELAYGIHAPNCLGYVMQVQCPSNRSGQLTVVDHVKLFRNVPELRFEHRIHEQILPAIRRLGGDVAFSDLSVVHVGADQTPEVRAQKLERDFRILNLDLQERPDHPFILFNLGMTCEDAGRFEDAEKHLRRCIHVSSSNESQVKKAYCLLVNSLRNLGRIDEAVEVASKGIELFPYDKELPFRRAAIFQDLNLHEKAISDYRDVLKPQQTRDFQSLDPGITGFKALHNLALSLVEVGSESEAIDCWKEATQLCPEFEQAWLALGKAMIRQSRVEETLKTIDEVRRVHQFEATAAILEARIEEANGRILNAQKILQKTWQSSSKENSELLEELSRVLMENHEQVNAIPVLEELKKRRPDDGAVMHNLGSALAASGRIDEAIQHAEQSLVVRPSYGPTERLLCSLRSESLHSRSRD